METTNCKSREKQKPRTAKSSTSSTVLHFISYKLHDVDDVKDDVAVDAPLLNLSYMGLVFDAFKSCPEMCSQIFLLAVGLPT